MIGVISNPADNDVVREFFELFKTSWEFYRAEGKYDVVLCAEDQTFDTSAKLVLYYAGRRIDFDGDQQTKSGCERESDCVLSYGENLIPIYGDSVTFPDNRGDALWDEDSQESAICLHESTNRVVARIGYDLFKEVRTLLTLGQPATNASMPTLELHIAVLRDLIIGFGIPLTEIPPVPEGFQFVACLTHDVDHPSIRKHKWDHTTFGFLYRAVFGSLRDLIRGRISLRNLLINWAAAVRLPLVHLRLAKDLWREFDDRYLEIEKGLPSTFFVIPFRNCPGMNSHGPAPSMRAARYGAQDIADSICKLRSAGCEVALHGIDAWSDSLKGRKELDEIRRLTGASEVGVRMHWLYYDRESPAKLEAAGATYDSTFGYNETVGYRAGTTQVYKSLDATHLLELPLHVMDTALFYPTHLDLSPRQAGVLLSQMVDKVLRFGGSLTVNWHDRSLAPERLWESSYSGLVQDLKSKGAWFATAGQATAWFRKRRSVEFKTDLTDSSTVRAIITGDLGSDLPGLRLRIHNAPNPRSVGVNRSKDYTMLMVDESIEPKVSSEASR